ncbi:TPA: hypothetical protein ACH3X2_011436 [Trebouxia sp. C0005]
MPLVIDHNTRSWESFDVQTASTLYWKALPVLVKQSDREEQTNELTVRILSGVNRNNHNSRILRIHLSSDEDLFFLHTLEVSEEEFQSLKIEQGILVDFGNFPGKVITLLQKCILAQTEDPPRFQAVLSATGSDSVFKIVETNDFNQLPHITLAFRPGNDIAVKQFLAFRLSEVKLSNEHLTADLNMTMGDRDSTQLKLEDIVEQLAESREMYERTLLEQQAHSKTKDAVALEEKTKELAQLKSTLDQERERLETKYREQLDALTTRGGDLDTENRQLRSLKYELDSKVSELSHKLGTVEGNCRSMEDELSRLQNQNVQLGKSKSEREVEANELRARLRSADEKVQAQKDHIAEQNQRCKDLEASSRQLEERCSELKEAAVGHEVRAKEAAAEVLKGNRIIEKVSNDLRMAKEKARRKQAIIGRQEEELAAREGTLDSMRKEQASSTRQVDHLQEDNRALKDEISSLKSKLEECKTQLQSNEQMIRWLNNQVNEAQLQFGGTATGSRYSFKPAALRGAAAVSGGSMGIPAGPSRSSVSPPAALHNAPYSMKYTAAAASQHITPSSLSSASRTDAGASAFPSAAGFVSHQLRTPGTAGSNSASIPPSAVPLKV